MFAIQFGPRRHHKNGHGTMCTNAVKKDTQEKEATNGRVFLHAAIEYTVCDTNSLVGS